VGDKPFSSQLNARNTETLNEAVSQIQPAAKQAGLIINRTKNKKTRTVPRIGFMR